jgi:hypothetical protein
VTIKAQSHRTSAGTARDLKETRRPTPSPRQCNCRTARRASCSGYGESSRDDTFARRFALAVISDTPRLREQERSRVTLT